MMTYNLWIGRFKGYSLFRPPYISLNRDGLCPLSIDFTILFMTFKLTLESKCCIIGTPKSREANFFDPFANCSWKIIKDSFDVYKEKHNIK